ncbi:uncharacterized protein [Mytilus edulis]
MDDGKKEKITNVGRRDCKVASDFISSRDEISGLPHLHFAFAIHSFVPRRYVETQNPVATPSVVGNYAEGMRIPPLVIQKSKNTFEKKKFIQDSDVTFLHVKDVIVDFPDSIDADQANYVISTESCHAGYCRLKILDNGNNEKYANLAIDHKGINYLGSKKSDMQFRTKISTNKNAIDSMLSSLLNKGHGFDVKFMDVFSGVPNDSFNLNRRPHTSVGFSGILVSAQKEEDKNKASSGLIEDVYQDEVDHQLAFQCKTWPPIANDWKTRERTFQWPSAATIDKVLHCPVHVVPVCHSSSGNADIEWKLSFAVAEKRLIAEEVGDTQRQCYLILYMLCLSIMAEGVLKISHIRSIFFHACENLETRMWHKNPAFCVLYLLDHLIKSVKKKQLPCYFVKSNNMMDHLTDLQVSQLERRLTNVRRKPIEELLSLGETYTILDVFPYNLNVRKLFAVVLADAKSYKDIAQAQQSVAYFISASNAVCNGFYHEYGFDHCASVFEDVIDNFVEPVLGKEEAVNQRDYIPHLLNQRNIEFSNDLPPDDIWKAITFCRFLIVRYVEGNTGAGLYEHLACLHHAAANIFKERRLELLKTADVQFNEALKREGEGHGAGLFVDYAHFLCTCGRHEEAVPHIMRVISTEKEKPESVNYYGRMESHTVDSYLQNEINTNGGIEVLSVVFAYYLLVDCYNVMKKTTDVENALEGFEKVCEQCGDLKAYNLLGYTYLKLGEKDKATKTFTRAQKEPSNKIVKQYLPKPPAKKGKNGHRK